MIVPNINTMNTGSTITGRSLFCAAQTVRHEKNADIEKVRMLSMVLMMEYILA